MKVPKNLKYSESHEWAEFCGDDSARIGLTDFAQRTLGSIVYIGLPNIGDEVFAGKSFGDIESVKVAADLISPVSGIVTAVNKNAEDAPESINDNPYETWLIEISGISERETLMDADEYSVRFGDKEKES